MPAEERDHANLTLLNRKGDRSGMTETPISLQNLRERIHVKAGADKT